MNDCIIVNNSDLFVTGEIGYDFQAEYFIQQLNSFEKDEEINVHIFSGGGSLFDALAIYDFVKLKGIKFNAYISGLSGSAATIIGASAENTYIGANSFYFVHRAYQNGGIETPESKALIDNANERLISIYKDLTKLSKPEIRNLLDKGDKGAFLTSKEAISLGFVNSQFKEAQLAANVDWYKNVNNKINNNMTDENLNELKSGIVTDVINSVKDLFKNKEKEVLDLESKKTEEKKAIEIQNKIEADTLELTNKIAELEEIISKSKAVETKVENSIEKDPIGEKKKESNWDLISNNFK